MPFRFGTVGSVRAVQRRTEREERAEHETESGRNQQHRYARGAILEPILEGIPADDVLCHQEQHAEGGGDSQQNCRDRMRQTRSCDRRLLIRILHVAPA